MDIKDSSDRFRFRKVLETKMLPLTLNETVNHLPPFTTTWDPDAGIDIRRFQPTPITLEGKLIKTILADKNFMMSFELPDGTTSEHVLVGDFTLRTIYGEIVTYRVWGLPGGVDLMYAVDRGVVPGETVQIKYSGDKFIVSVL